jgi:hypothetical protein
MGGDQMNGKYGAGGAISDKPMEIIEATSIEVESNGE